MKLGAAVHANRCAWVREVEVGRPIARPSPMRRGRESMHRAERGRSVLRPRGLRACVAMRASRRLCAHSTAGLTEGVRIFASVDWPGRCVRTDGGHRTQTLPLTGDRRPCPFVSNGLEMRADSYRAVWKAGGRSMTGHRVRLNTDMSRQEEVLPWGSCRIGLRPWRIGCAS